MFVKVRLWTSLLLLCLGITASVGSLAIPKTIYDNAELVDVRYGWPVSFISQNSSRWPLGGDGPPLPHSRSILSPWEIPTDFMPLPFVINVILWGIVFYGVGWSLRSTLTAARRPKAL